MFSGSPLQKLITHPFLLETLPHRTSIPPRIDNSMSHMPPTTQPLLLDIPTQLLRFPRILTHTSERNDLILLTLYIRPLRIGLVEYTFVVRIFVGFLHRVL